jgi:hypothetical protein
LRSGSDKGVYPVSVEENPGNPPAPDEPALDVLVSLTKL